MHSIWTLCWHGIATSLLAIAASIGVFGTLVLVIGRWFYLKPGPETPFAKAIRFLQKKR